MFFENHQQEFDATGCNFEREVNEIQIRIAKIEDQLDITMSNTKVNLYFWVAKNIFQLFLGYFW